MDKNAERNANERNAACCEIAADLWFALCAVEKRLEKELKAIRALKQKLTDRHGLSEDKENDIT